VSTAATIERSHLVNNQYVEPSGTETFESFNPAHKHEVIGRFPRGNAADVDRAVAAARKAFPAWKRTPWPVRAEVIAKAAQILEERKEELAKLMTREMGKVLLEARGDVQEAIDMGKYIAGQGRRGLGETIPSELTNKWAMTTREPLGVIGVITPWNFPIAIPSWKIFPALLAGNTVVFKPAGDTPLCGLRFAEALIDAGLPEGVLNVVFGSGAEVGDPITEHPDVNGISLTGSVEVGRHVAEICGRTLKRVGLELGGKNAIVVLADADLNLAIDGALWGAFGTSGQRCTASSRLVVESKVAAEFAEQLVKRVRLLKIGDGLDETNQVGPVINQKQLENVHAYTKIGQEDGAKLLCGGEVVDSGDLASGWFYAPTVFTDAKPTMRIAQEEIFGPTTTIIPVEDFDAALAAANSTQYGLSASIFTQDVNKAFRAVNELEAGIVYVNAPTIGAEIQLPFGGVKNTGNGHREAGATALDEFTEWKSIYIDYSGRLQRAQIDNRP
jgi:aldehyde dehydrogenase (NAD+)